MIGFSRVWERVTGTGRGANRAKSFKSRSLRVESLEDRALLSVTTGALDPSVFNGENSGALEAAAVPTDAAIPLPPAQTGDAAGQTITVAAPNEAEANRILILTPPTNVVAQWADGGGGYTIQVSWDANARALGYGVRYFYSADNGETWEEHTATVSEGTSFTLESAPRGRYAFAVKCNGNGSDVIESGYSAPVEIGVPSLSIPTEVNAEVNKDWAAATISWNKVDNATGYEVSYSNDGGDNWSTPVCIEGQFSWSFKWLEAGDYLFRVQAVDSTENYYPSAYGYTKTVSIPLWAPTGVKVDSVDGYTVTVSWDAVEHAEEYVVYYTHSGDQESGKTASVPATTVTFTCKETGSYAIKVVASASGYETSPESSSVNVLVPVLPIPTNIQTSVNPINPSTQNVTISWDPVKGASGYEIIYGNRGTQEGKVSVGPEVSEYTFNRLSPGNKWFKIKALGDGGKNFYDSAYSEMVYVNLPILMTPRPTVAVAGYNVQLKWAVVSNAASYTVSYTSNGGTTWSDPTSVTVTNYSIDLPTGEYQFRVQALSSSFQYYPSNYGYSETVIVPSNIPLTAPTLNTVTAVQDGQAAITVNWNPDGNAASYTLEYKKSTEGDSAWKNVTVPDNTGTCTIENLELETSYNIRVMAIAKPGSGYDNSDYGTAKVTTPLTDWYLMDYADYTNFRVHATADTAYLYGVAKDGKENELKRAGIDQGANLTIYSNSTARNVTITAGAMQNFGNIVYVGGKSKNDTIKLEGTDDIDCFTVDQETMIVDVYDRPGKEAKTQQVVFDTVTRSRGDDKGATVKLSGTRSVTIDGGDDTDTFCFVKCGTTYDLLGDGDNQLNFENAESGVKLDLGKTKAQSIFSRQKGKLILHGNITEVVGTRFSDTITTAANTVLVFGMGGSDTVKMVGAQGKSGEVSTSTQVFLEGDAQKVTGKGSGQFIVDIGKDQSGSDGTKSTVNMSSVKNGSLSLTATGNKMRVTGTKGDDMLDLTGSDIDVQGNDGNDTITVKGGNVKVRGGKGDDIVDLTETYGKCVIDGGDGNDMLFGGEGNDTIRGGSGNNILIGLRGADKLTGGRGRDILIANQTSGMAARTTDLNKVLELLKAGDMEGVIDQLGLASVADGEKDVLKRGGGEGKLFYANTDDDLLGNDFDTTDYKLDKGDLLFTGLSESRATKAEGKQQAESARKEEAKSEAKAEEKRQAEPARKDEAKADAAESVKADKADKLRDAAKAQER